MNKVDFRCMVQTGWRHSIIYKVKDEQLLVRTFRQHTAATKRFAILAKHDNHFHAGYYESSGSYPLARALSRRETRANVKSRALRCGVCLSIYLRKAPREVLLHVSGDESGDIGREHPYCYRHTQEPKDGLVHGLDDDALEGFSPDCDGTVRSPREELGERGSSDTEGEQESGDEPQAKRRCIGWGRGTQLQEQLLKLTKEVFPRFEGEMAAEIASRNMHMMTLHPEYSKTQAQIAELHRMEVVNMMWAEILDAIPDSLYEAKDCSYLPVDESIKWLEQWCEHQKIPIERFTVEVKEIMDKTRPKINSLLLYGPPNSGKTLVANSIVESVIYYANLQSMSGHNTFEFAESKLRRALIMNEPHCSDLTVNTLKNILEGQNVTIQVKYKADQILTRTPCFITTNNKIAECTLSRHANEEALMARCIKYNVRAMSSLAKCDGKLHPGLWKVLYAKYIDNVE